MARTNPFASLLLASLVLVGCVAERSFPEPAQMCENLVQVCGDGRISEFQGVEECFQIGRAGREDARDEDQCFAVYDECISDCQYWSFLIGFYADAAADAGSSADAAKPDAAAEVRDGATMNGAGDDAVADASTPQQ